MNRAEKERQARRQRMLAREQGHTTTNPIPGTSGDIGLSTPRRVNRSAPPPTGRAGQGSDGNVKTITPLIQQRQRRRLLFWVVAALLAALAMAALTGALSNSIALLGDTVDSVTLYLNRGSAGWPVNTGIAEPLQIEELAGGFVELGAEDVVVYSAYGARSYSFQPGYARPALAAGSSRFVVYNRAGKELQVASRTRTLYTQQFEENILLCAMGDNGTLAVVTESGRYAAQLQVYNASFSRIYNWQMTQNDGTPIAVDFAPDSRRFAAGLLAAKDGQLQSAVYFMDTASDTQGAVYTASQGSMLVQLTWQSENRVLAIFDTYLAVLDPRTGTETARYDYGGGTLQSAAARQDRVALLLNLRGGNNLIALDKDLVPTAEIPARQAFAITAVQDEIYLLCADSVESYGYDGLQNWVRDDLTGRPLAVVEAGETLLFTGTTAQVLEAP